VLDHVEGATAALLDAVETASPTELLGPSSLPGWSRLTILAHLRYVAAASRRMTAAALAGRSGAMYPGGRGHRPATLEPTAGESASAVVASLRAESTALHELWRSLTPAQWATELDEPELGTITPSTLLFMRWTEVELHGVDLDLGLGPWSEAFVAAALSPRVRALPRLRRRSDADLTVNGSWALVGGDEIWFVRTSGRTTAVEPNDDARFEADSVIEGDTRSLVGLLLGRVEPHELELTGDIHLGRAIKKAFPGP
jgi:maleylpyruvate isomerase